MNEKAISSNWFATARYGMFVHYGLYSLLGRGEWAMNRERIQTKEYRKLAAEFTADKFDPDAICKLAVASGMKYINFTTMHHDGFRLYDTDLSNFNSMKTSAKRDLVAELVTAARNRGLKVSLYHSLNNWYDSPDAVDALENPSAYETFIRNTHERIKELVTRFNPIDLLWYDGWWPYHADGWKSVAMNEMVRKIQPHILFNGRNGLAGDFATPEGHMSTPIPWRPWEACMTLNNHWGFHKGDTEWKSPSAVIDLLVKAGAGNGNLLLNVGPCGDGSIPKETVSILKKVGAWLKMNREVVTGNDVFSFNLEKRGNHNGDWAHNGPFTAKGNFLYHILRYWPGSEFSVGGIQNKVKKIVLIGKKNESLKFKQDGERIAITGLPQKSPSLMPVIRFECDGKPSMYLTGGMRVPQAPHPPYDPCPSDIKE